MLKEYHEIGSSLSAMAQNDTPRQKEIICDLIDECDGDTIYLDWEGDYLTVEPPLWAVILTYILTLGLNIGLSLWIIRNEHEDYEE